MASQIEVLRVLKILGDVYPSYQLNSSAVEMYIQLLADIPSQILEQATLDQISRSTFFPAIAELRAAAFDLLEATQPAPNSYDAWAEVQSEIHRVGHYGQPKFENPLTAQAVNQLGWVTLCLSDNLVADRAHFIQAYQKIEEQHRRDARRLPIVTDMIATLKAEQLHRLTGGK